MIKRLIPVAAAVVLGLSPNLASAASSHHNGGKVYENTAMPASSAKSLNFDVTNVTQVEGKGVSMAGGRLNIGFEGDLVYNYTNNNGAPLYITDRGADLTSSGDMYNAGFKMPIDLRINRNISARVMLEVGSTMRTVHFKHQQVHGGGPNQSAAGGASGYDNYETLDAAIPNAYVTYQSGALAVFGGWMTSGLTKVNLGTNVAPQFHDYLEYTAANLGVLYKYRGFHVSGALIDPGLSDVSVSSRRAANGDDSSIDNFSLRAGYHGSISGHKFNFDASYLKDINDLTFINAIRNIAGAEPTSQSSGLALSGGMTSGKYDFSVYYMTLRKNSGLQAATATNMDTDNAKLFDFDLTYHLDSGATVGAFYNNNRNGYASGLPRKQYGLTGKHTFAKNTFVSGAIWHEKRNRSNGGAAAANDTSRNATRFSLALGYYLG